MRLFKRSLPRRKPRASFKPIEITLVIHPPFPVGAVTGLRVLQERLQEQFLNGSTPQSVVIDWNTLTLLDTIVDAFNKGMIIDILGD